MARHNELGLAGEEEACRYLMHRGYRLLDRNWRVGHLELDIVADYYGEIVFVEVKTRSSQTQVPVEAAVNLEKQKNILEAAHHYILDKHLDQPFRFDIITVVGERRPFEIQQIENAFDSETLRYQKKYGVAKTSFQ